MQEFCRIMGVDVDLSGFRAGMSDDDVARKLAELDAGLDSAEAQEPEPPPTPGKRSKSKRALQREARERAEEELRTRDLGRLHKQLAKLLHPDLEQHPTLRVEKEAAMKRLTTAYKDNDLHTMLRLEVEWMVREQEHASQLSDATLAVYNAVLKEQVLELEQEPDNLHHHPRYAPLLPFLGALGACPVFRGAEHKRNLQMIADGMDQTIRHLQSDRALDEVAAPLRSHAQAVARSRTLDPFL